MKLGGKGKPASSSSQCLPNVVRIFQVNLCCKLVIARESQQFNKHYSGLATCAVYRNIFNKINKVVNQGWLLSNRQPLIAVVKI